MLSTELTGELTDWIFAEGRKSGDTAVITPENSEVSYVIYYAGAGDPQWKISIRNSMLDNTIMPEYIERITQDLEVEDPKGRLRYLQVQAEEEAADNGGDSGVSAGDSAEAAEGSEEASGASEETESGSGAE